LAMLMFAARAANPYIITQAIAKLLPMIPRVTRKLHSSKGGRLPVPRHGNAQTGDRQFPVALLVMRYLPLLRPVLNDNPA
jgi:hypothetical protein